MGNSKGAILLLTHSRANMLSELINNIDSLEDRKNHPLIVVRQLGDESVGKVLDDCRSKINMLIELDGSAGSVPQNISANRIAGYAAGFDAYNVDWILAVEDDVLLSSDTLTFIDYIFEKYKKNRKFRGINLGSKLVKSEIGKNSFCKTRFGIYGQGSMITIKTWRKLKKFNLISVALTTHWDSAFEYYVKTGFMVAPNNSRYIDRGVNGTHMGSHESENYFSDLEGSFVGFEHEAPATYINRDLGYRWREDLKKYSFYDNVKYSAYFFLLQSIRKPPIKKNSKFFSLAWKCLNLWKL